MNTSPTPINRTGRPTRRVFAAMAIAAVVASCGSSDDGAEVSTDSVAVTDAPATDPPATDPPPTDPPVTDPPPTDPPVTDPPATDPPETDPPVTEPPATDPPTTDPPPTDAPAAEDGALTDAERAQIQEAISGVFSNAESAEELAARVEGGDDIVPVFQAFLDVAGGLGVQEVGGDVTAIVTDGDTGIATVDLLIDGAVFTEGLPIEIVRVDGTWSVSRTGACTALVIAGVACPEL